MKKVAYGPWFWELAWLVIDSVVFVGIVVAFLRHGIPFRIAAGIMAVAILILAGIQVAWRIYRTDAAAK